MGFRRSLISDMFRGRAKPAEAGAELVVAEPISEERGQSLVNGYEILMAKLKNFQSKYNQSVAQSDPKAPLMVFHGRRSRSKEGHFTVFVAFVRPKRPLVVTPFAEKIRGFILRPDSSSVSVYKADFSRGSFVTKAGNPAFNTEEIQCEFNDSSNNSFLPHMLETDQKPDAPDAAPEKPDSFDAAIFWCAQIHGDRAAAETVHGDILEQRQCAKRAKRRFDAADAALNPPQAAPAGQ